MSNIKTAKLRIIKVLSVNCPTCEMNNILNENFTEGDTFICGSDFSVGGCGQHILLVGTEIGTFKGLSSIGEKSNGKEKE